MIDRIIDLLVNFIDDLAPFKIINEYEAGIKLRAGKFRAELTAGIYFKIPFIDEILKCSVVTTTLSIPTQSLTTSDLKQIVVKSVVKYSINDVKKLMLNVYDVKDALSDTVQGIIKKQISDRQWSNCQGNELDHEITKKVRVEVRKWGIEVESITLTDMGLIPSLRLFNEVSNIINE